MNRKESIDIRKVAAGLSAAAVISTINFAGCSQVETNNQITSTLGDIAITDETEVTTSRTNISAIIDNTSDTAPETIEYSIDSSDEKNNILITESPTQNIEITTTQETTSTTKESIKSTVNSITTSTSETRARTTVVPTYRDSSKPTDFAVSKKSPTPTPKPTPIPTAKPTPTVEPTPTPIPTTETTSELDGVAPERLTFTKKLLTLYANCSTNDADEFKKYITREQIINFGKTGEGLTVVNKENGTPGILLVNCQDNVVSSFRNAMDQMRAYDANYVDVLTKNGVCSFMVNRWDVNIGSVFTYSKSGLVVWNATDQALAPADISYSFKRTIETEAFGIKVANLGGDYAKYGGFMKELLSSDCWWNMYKKTGQTYCRDLSYSSYLIAKTMYNQVYAPVTFQDDKIQNLLKNIRDNNLASPWGGPWSEISQNIADRPDWNPGDIN